MTFNSPTINIQGNPVTGTATAGQFLIENSGATGSSWVTITGDIVASTGTPGAITVTALRGKTLNTALATLGSAQDGYALTWVNASSDWEAKPATGGGGGITALTGDVLASGSGSVASTVQSLTGGSFGSGTGVVEVLNASAAPTSNPSGAGYLYEKSGTLTHRGSGGTTYDMAPAGSGTINSQAAIVNRKVAYARTSATTAVTVLSYTVPFSVTFGACVMVEVLWSARDTTAANTMTAGIGKAMSGFSVNSSGTVAQFPTTIGGSNMVTSMFTYTTSLVKPAWDEITFDNVTANRFATTTSATPISFTTSSGGVVNVLVNPNITNAVNLDWTVDIYIQVT